MSAAGSAGPVPLVVARLTSDWSESTVTWANRPFGASPYAQASTLLDQPQSATWDVTALVAGWVDGTQANYGLEIRGPEGSRYERWLGSREAAGAELTVWVGSAPPPPGPLSGIFGSGWKDGVDPDANWVAPAPIPNLDLAITHLEVTQSIQCYQSPDATCLNNSVPLVLNKATLARVYVRVLSGSIPPGGLANVPVRLIMFQGGQPVTRTAVLTAQANPQRFFPGDPPGDTANFTFVVPGGANQPIAFQAEVNRLPNDGITYVETNYANNRYPGGEFAVLPLTFYNAPTLRVLARGVALRAANGTVYPAPIPDLQTFDFIRDTYPVPGISLRLNATPLVVQMGGNSLVNDDWDRMLRAVTAWERGMNPRWPYYHLYGLVPEGVPATNNTGGMGWVPAASLGALNWQAVGYNGNMFVAAHEIGHNLGRKHAPQCLPGGSDPDPNWPLGTLDEVGDVGSDTRGWDTRTPNSLVPATARDLMGYCGGYWISGYTANGIFVRRQAVMGFPLAQAGTLAPATAQDYLVASGAIFTTGVVAVAPFYHMTHPAGLSDAEGSGSYSLELQTGAGQALFIRRFEPHYAPCHENCTVGEGFFAETLPYTTTTEQIVVKHGADVLHTIPVSASPPTVTVLSPNGGEQWGQTAAQTITWEGGDADGGPVYYNVLFSHDGGANWSPLANFITATSLSLHATLFPGTNQALIRVVATDGVNSASDDSNAVFSIEHKPPMVHIEHAGSSLSAHGGAPIVLYATSSDLEDGDLDSSQLVWRSDRDGLLGIGPVLIWGNASPGRHVVTLTGTDADGNTGSTAIDVEVGSQVYLPLLRR